MSRRISENPQFETPARIPPQTPPAGGKSAEAGRILAESGFCGGNAEQTALRADHIFGGNLNSEFWRKGWDSNPRWAFAHSRFRVGAVMTASVPFQCSVS